MKKISVALMLALIVLCSLGAEKISGYIGVSTGYEFNIIEAVIDRANGHAPQEKKMNFQGVPFYIEGETYFCPWVGGYYGLGIATFPTILEEDEISYKPFDDKAPVLYTSPYLGLALRYDFTDMFAMVLNTGLSYMAWKLPPVDEDIATPSDYIHMMNVKIDLAAAFHPKHNISVRVGLKVDTPVLTGFQYSTASSGIRLGDTSATASGVKLVPYIGMGYAYGR